MKHLQFLENEQEYNEGIAIDGYAELPMVVTFPEDSEIKPKYLQAPKNQITCGGREYPIFGSGQNIKRVWIDDELVFSDDNERKWHELKIPAYNTSIPVPMNSLPLIEITLDEEDGAITENDEFQYLMKDSTGTLSWFGGPIWQMDGNGVIKIIDGKLFINPILDCTNDIFPSSEGWWLRMFRNNKGLNMNVRWYGSKPSAKMNIINTSLGNFQPFPGDYIDYIEVYSNVDINRETDGLIVIDTFTEEASFAPINDLDIYYGFNGFPLTISVLGTLSGHSLVWARMKSASDNIDNVTIEDFECFDTEIKVYYKQSAEDLRLDADVTTTVSYERYNRFFPVNFNSSSITSINADCFKYTKYIYPNNFKNCQGLTNIIIPNGIEEIYNDAFIDCTNLTSITLPETLVTIGRDAFEKCSSLQEIICLCPISVIVTLLLPSNDGILKLPKGTDYSAISDMLNEKNWTVEYI